MDLAPWSYEKIFVAIQSEPVFELELEMNFLVRLCWLCDSFNWTVLRLDQWFCPEKLASVFNHISLGDFWVFFVQSELDVLVHWPFVNFALFIRQVVRPDMAADANYVSDLAWELSLLESVIDLP